MKKAPASSLAGHRGGGGAGTYGYQNERRGGRGGAGYMSPVTSQCSAFSGALQYSTVPPCSRLVHQNTRKLRKFWTFGGTFRGKKNHKNFLTYKVLNWSDYGNFSGSKNQVIFLKIILTFFCKKCANTGQNDHFNF